MPRQDVPRACRFAQEVEHANQKDQRRRELRDGCILLVVALGLLLAATTASAREDKAGILNFEGSSAAGTLKDWLATPSGPASTVFIDSTVVHGGRFAGRLERGPASTGEFSSLATTIPIDFPGDSLELRGWVRYEGVTGFAGLWQRQDGMGRALQFDNMASRKLTGTAQWQELRLVLPLDRQARSVKVGALLLGQGRVWVDDMQVLAASDRAAANRAMASWVAGIGEAPPCRVCATSPSGRPMIPRLDWLSDRALLGNDLVARLHRTYINREARTEQFYVSFEPGVGNPNFSHELSYPGKGVPDAGYRLLALYRLWNIVEYWFPDRDIMEEDWDGVLREFIPRMAAADSSDSYALTTIALIARMHDTHANIWRSLRVRPPQGACQLPVTLRFIENQLVVTGYSNATLGPASGLGVGDVIAALDGVPVDTLVTRWRPLYAASNEAARLRDIAASIGRGACDSVRLTTDRPSGRTELTLSRVPAASLDSRAGSTHDHPGDTFRRLGEDIAYLKLSSVKADSIPEYIRRVAGAKCLVIDIRNYPSESVIFALGGHLVSQSTPFAMFTTGDASNPGSFAWTTAPVSIEPLAPHFEGKVAILVDETSQSHAEYTAMAFRAAPAAIVVGSTTAGADGNVSSIPLPGGLQGLMSGIGVFYPDHRPTQRIGIVPDLVVRPTLAGIRAMHDRVLEAAVERVLGRAMIGAERAALQSPAAP